MSPNLTPKVSVIVPVYNTELYVERAIVSLMEQTLDDVQFIIIDDGSKDNSLNIIKQVIAHYPARQGQVTLISRENRGVAATRAQGMELATGDYIIHLDSDDWAELNWLEAMYNKAIAENADVVVCDYSAVYATKSVYVKQIVANTGKECVNNLLFGNIFNANWNKLVKRTVFENGNIKFLAGCDMGEDFYVSFLCFYFSENISHINGPLYFYNNYNVQSLTSRYDLKSIYDVKKIVDIIIEFLQNENTLVKYGAGLDKMKLIMRSRFVMRSNGDYAIKKIGLDLYPETNYLIFTRAAPRILMITYLFNKLGLSYFLPIIDYLQKIKIRLLRG